MGNHNNVDSTFITKSCANNIEQAFTVVMNDQFSQNHL